MSAKTDHDIALARVLASLFAEAAHQHAEDDAATDGQVVACLESCRAAGITAMRITAGLRNGPTTEAVAAAMQEAIAEALDDAGLDPEGCPRIAAACAEEWRAAFLCH